MRVQEKFMIAGTAVICIAMVVGCVYFNIYMIKRGEQIRRSRTPQTQLYEEVFQGHSFVMSRSSHTPPVHNPNCQCDWNNR